MSDLEEGIIDDTPAHQVPSMAEDEEHEYQIHQVEGGEVAGEMIRGQKKRLLYYWLLVIAASVIVLNNNANDAAPKDQLFPPEFHMFIVFLCAIIGLILGAMN